MLIIIGYEVLLLILLSFINQMYELINKQATMHPLLIKHPTTSYFDVAQSSALATGQAPNLLIILRVVLSLIGDIYKSALCP